MTETERASCPAAHRQMTEAQMRAYYKRIRRQKKRRRQIILMAGLLVLLLAVLIGLIVHMTRKDKLRGTWALDQVTVYQFDGKGSGGLCLPQQTYSFRYSVDGAHLWIDFEDVSANDAGYTYEVQDNILILTSDSGQEYRFNRQR